jgi:hypothetical protein
MKRTISILFILSSSFFSFQKPTTEILKDPAYQSYLFLNEVRSDPKAYSKSFGINLNNVKPSPALIWSDTLAREAERKAADMATQNYFAHVDKKGYGMNYYVNKAGYKLPEFWLDNKKNNQVESLGANTEGAEGFIKQLIIDKGVPELGHRKHLLSMGPFYQQNTHIGIGIAYNPKSEYGYYCCVLIAPASR